VGLFLTIISALAVSIDLMLSVLPLIFEVYAQQNKTGTNMTLPQRIPSQQQNQTQDIGMASEIESFTTGNIIMVGYGTSGSIREAMAEPDEFLGNITENVATSGPVETVINGTSNVLGL
jgi:hypothetical protein